MNAIHHFEDAPVLMMYPYMSCIVIAYQMKENAIHHFEDAPVPMMYPYMSCIVIAYQMN